MMRKENEISSKFLTVLLLPVMQIPIGNKLNDVILELGYIYKRLKSFCFTEKMVPNSQAALLEKKKVRKEGTRIRPKKIMLYSSCWPHHLTEKEKKKIA